MLSLPIKNTYLFLKKRKEKEHVLKKEDWYNIAV